MAATTLRRCSGEDDQRRPWKATPAARGREERRGLAAAGVAPGSLRGGDRAEAQARQRRSWPIVALRRGAVLRLRCGAAKNRAAVRHEGRRVDDAGEQLRR
ncbi:hypothetical protein Syun_017083 [Stephania yunnanensis]|uniref:Uncharacterized protein n=1 Tax=Stephania yunnanensis TaxID=152371 RepID=A0AAP0J6A2_9MAGN